jgi:hypothetical protein
MTLVHTESNSTDQENFQQKFQAEKDEKLKIQQKLINSENLAQISQENIEAQKHRIEKLLGKFPFVNNFC